MEWRAALALDATVPPVPKILPFASENRKELGNRGTEQGWEFGTGLKIGMFLGLREGRKNGRRRKGGIPPSRKSPKTGKGQGGKQKNVSMKLGVGERRGRGAALQSVVLLNQSYIL